MGGQFSRVCFMVPRSPLLTSISLLNTNSTLLLIIVDMQKKKTKKKKKIATALNVYLQENYWLVIFHCLWFGLLQ